VVELIAKHRRKGILVDTNILLLYLVGSVSIDLIGRHKRTEKYAPEDYKRLDALLAQFDRVVTTPQVLTEASNLAAQVAEPARDDIVAAMSRAVDAMKERHVAAIRLVREDCFIDFGLTDAGIVVAAVKGYLILTDDFPLSNYLATAGLDVINFNHLRDI
jgi:rRNA-processing protein FCF1